MVIGKRLRQLREEKKLSQGDIEKRTGLLRCYTSRVENGHTVPSVDTLEKYARALEVPIYKLFHEGDGRPLHPKVLVTKRDNEWGAKGKEHEELRKFAGLLSRLDARQRELILHTALQMARKMMCSSSFGQSKASALR